MKKSSQAESGKIINHGNGVGVPSPDDVNQRARENALINARARIEKDDFAQAREELRGTELPPATTASGEGITRAVTRDLSEPISDYGHEIPNAEAPDEQQAMERLVTEGVEEAQHDQMVAARRKKSS